jgi:protein-S-isoprenylcysteine O-methyltransferase Ste14
MRASAFEFRLRMLIMVTVIALGLWSPWIEAWGTGRRTSLLEWLALELSRLGLLRFTDATPVVIGTAALIAAAGAALRVWGTAYLGSAVVNNLEMKAGGLLADGPYRYVRNPLYLGSFCTIVAICFVMPPTGALFVLVLIPIFLLRLILSEETFLSSKLGEVYREYLRSTPRLLPRLRSNVAHGLSTPHWGRAVLAELNPIGVFVSVAFLSWRYDNLLIIKAILVSFGVSLVVRAILPAPSDLTVAA